MKKKLLLCCTLSIAVLAVSACDLGSSTNTGSNPGQTNAAIVSPPPSAQNSDNVNAANFGGVPPLEIKQGGSLGSLGLNLETLFVEKLDNDARINRLENAILAMQNDLQTLAPSMQRLAVIEKDLDALVSQLETLVQEESAMIPAPAPENVETVAIMPPPASVPEPNIDAPLDLIPDAPVPVPPAPAPIPAPAPAPTPAPATPQAAPVPALAKAIPAGLNISGLRLGEHAGKTRLVFDMNGPAKFRTDLDNAEKILIVEIDKAAWSAAPVKKLSSPLVQSYTVQDLEGDGGTRIILTLKKAARLANESLLTPEPSANNHRLVIDLAYE